MRFLYLLIALVFIQFESKSQTGTIALQSFGTGFASPVDIENCGDSRLFVVEQDGLIRILNSNGTINPTPFLNITSLTNQSGEQGLLGLAFHPNYSTNGLFYINYTNTSGNTVIARYSVNSGNPNIANTTGTILLTVNQPFTNHNGGTLKFGSDGYLYIGMGDGGSGGDPGNRAQNINELLGKMLRIDVNSGSPYGIPPTNPYVGIAGADEIWAIGLRNPWKFSFDRQTGDLWIADVGQNQYEEVNRATASESGLNYGWRCYEGNTAYNTAGCAAQSTMKSPLFTTNHTNGFCSITGGYVYRGTQYPNFQGKYFFSDYCKAQIGSSDGLGNVSFSATFSGNNFVSFGEDVNGELYVASINGTIYKLIDSSLSVTENSLTSVKVYPNPVTNELYISNSDIANPIRNIEILDLQGKSILKETNKSQPITYVNTNHLSNGLYFLKITNDSGSHFIHKLIKE
ncbi:PQQ-dependent sugar dehydrogenase [Flavobacterium terrae]|uniref:Por secretion system C-terminal sorting domain-containing protein n=1 Tax=Flavobacterium terrae TaxID=415425 RepID=A0A1M6AJK1_9FLAO|nr:PQQ-dependent sugar dehydrogenase [Flavobacterium terrae]SHI36646.1 Por secretion system C-terminal sorting domain-containing protein [Flavobacterium terrae]